MQTDTRKFSPAAPTPGHEPSRPQEIPIRPLSTGTVQVKTAMAWGRGPARLARTLLDRNFTQQLPIHAWLIEHPDGPILVDAGELATTPDPPIARFKVDPEDEIDQRLTAAGVSAQQLRSVVLTHLHGDHMNGIARLPGAQVTVCDEALTRRGRRALARLGATPTPLQLRDERFGAFARSAPITADGRVVAVPLPGHARGQIAVIVVEDGYHVMIAADSAYTQQQMLAAHVDGVSVSARDAVRSMRTILEHARQYPTVFLPSHDPDSAGRLSARSVARPPSS